MLLVSGPCTLCRLTSPSPRRSSIWAVSVLFGEVYKSSNASPQHSMDPQYSLPLPSRARIADQHRIPRMLHVPKLRQRPAERPNIQAINAAGFDSPQTKIQALLAKLSIVEAQNRALRSRCQQLETELDRVARSVGSSPSALRPPRPVQHRCTPRPGDMPPPLRYTAKTVVRKENAEVARSSGFSSINDLLESYMGPTPTIANRTTPTSPNFSRPNPGRLVSETF